MKTSWLAFQSESKSQLIFLVHFFILGLIFFIPHKAFSEGYSADGVGLAGEQLVQNVSIQSVQAMTSIDPTSAASAVGGTNSPDMQAAYNFNLHLNLKDQFDEYSKLPFLKQNVFLWFLIALCLAVLAMFLSYALLLYRKIGAEKEQKLSYVSNHDPLTGVYNRKGMLRFLDVTSKFNPGVKFAAICLDIVDFKYINYVYGEKFGDKLLCLVASELEDIFSHSQAVARVAVNEFVAVDFESYDMRVSEQLINKIISRFEEGIEVDGQVIPVRFNIGVSLYPNDTLDPSVLLQYVHVAMLRAKQSGNKICEFYHTDMTVNTYRRIQLLRRFEQAIAEDSNDISLVYQPILEAGAASGIKAEALMRWHDDVLGFVPPDEFIAVIEETAVTAQLNRWVLNTAVKQILEWKEKGADVVVAINVSRFDLYYKEFLSDIDNVLQTTDINTDNLIIEIRESTLFNHAGNAALFDALLELKERGFSLAVDDFGTGFSNFNQLNAMPVDIVKIDKSLVQDMHRNSRQHSICEAIFNLCKAMAKKCVVEGVEYEEQFDMMREMGMHFFQGYYISKPLPADQLLGFWKTQTELITMLEDDSSFERKKNQERVI